MRFAALFLLVGASACSQISVDVLTQAPPGRDAFVDVETDTIFVTRGVAVALECHESVEGYYGPCRDMTVALDDAELALILPAHLDALPGQTVRTPYNRDDETVLSGPQKRQGFVIGAQQSGSTTLTIGAASGDFPLTLIVEDAPAPAEEAP